MRPLLYIWALFLIVLFFTTARTDRRYQQRRFSDYNEAKDTNQQEQTNARMTLTEADRRQCSQRNYEPLLSFGDFFFARTTATSERSLLAAYTKNGTILVCTISALCFGILLGMSLSTVLFGKRRAPSVHRSTSTSDLLLPTEESTSSEEDGLTDSQEKALAAIDALHLDNTQRHAKQKEEAQQDDTEAESDRTTWSSAEMEKADRGPPGRSAEKCERPYPLLRRTKSHSSVSFEKPDCSARITTEVAAQRLNTDRLCGQIQELTEALRRAQEPMTTFIAAIKGISLDVGSLRNVTHWLAWRKAKKDMWLQATDNMSYGILVMNVTLAISAALFGRWQDWGLQCNIRYFSWSIHSLLGMMWCWVEEQFIFLLGCSVWWFTMRYAFSSNFLKRKQPSSTILLFLTLICTGSLHSFTVALLGGSWTISFSIWLLYSMFLVQTLESAKESIPGGDRTRASVHSTAEAVVSNETLSAFTAVIVFPVLAGVAPFWNVGLYLSLMSILERCVQTLIYYIYQMADDFLEFLVH